MEYACFVVVWLVVRPCGFLVETIRELATRGKRDEYEWHGFWRGCWGQGGCEVYAGRTTRQLSLSWSGRFARWSVWCAMWISWRIWWCSSRTPPSQTRDRSLTIAELGMKLETKVERQVSVVDMLETRVQAMQKVVADLDNNFQRVGGRPRAACRRNCKGPCWIVPRSFRSLARSVKNLEQCGDEVAYRLLTTS